MNRNWLFNSRLLYKMNLTPPPTWHIFILKHTREIFETLWILKQVCYIVNNYICMQKQGQGRASHGQVLRVRGSSIKGAESLFCPGCL